MSKLKRLLSIVLTISLLCTTFLSTGMIAHASMLPLEEVNAYLTLSGYSKDDLKMPIDQVLNNLKDTNGNPIIFPTDATRVWHYEKDAESGLETYEEYIIGDSNKKIDLYPGEGIDVFQFELIVGKNGQLESNNKRYIVRAYLSNNFKDDIQPVIYIQKADGTRFEAKPDNQNFWIYTYTSGAEELNFDLTFGTQTTGDLCDLGTVWLSFKSELSNNPRVRIEFHPVNIYSGGIHVPDYSQTLTEDLLNVDMEETDAGLQITGKQNTDYTYRMVTYVDEIEYSSKYVCVRYWAWYPCHVGKMYDNLTSKNQVYSNIQSDFNAQTKVNEVVFELKPNYKSTAQYYFNYDFVMEKGYWGLSGQTNYDSLVKNIYLGHYNSIEDAQAAGATDVTSAMLKNGYLADYSGDGIDFTVFKYYRLSQSFPLQYDTLADKVTVKVVDNPNVWKEFTDDPIIGDSDPWFRVNGVTDSSGNSYDDIYVVENGKNINMDTYYGYGYQTVFIKDSTADLANLKPEFWYANTDRLYAVSKDTGNKVEDDHTRNFEVENQQYTLVFDGINERNYWLTFKRLNSSGPKLFVNGPASREVILDEYFEFKHDILIANIGNAPLEDLKVELKNAENVKLDPYWTVGGEGNDTLAAFTTIETNSKYGELANLAKIRLLPDGEGEVKGTLVISAKNQKSVEIVLNGKAQNPEIVTETLDDAVKYVPYQHIIATNNMHDWVETQFSIVEGQLPNGITLNAETGEIYGVPTVPEGSTATTYTFTVKATFLVDGVEGYFDSATKQFSITVKPNTDENVYLASDGDEGYYILDHIGTEDGQYHYVIDVFEDTVFRSNGTYGEFKRLWLNGEPLVEGVDYESEEGSTKITVKGQTFENKTNTDETNTIAMEFRNEDDELNRTSQNFVPKTYPNVDKLIAKINALPAANNITLSNKNAVQSARSDYNALSSTEKNKVTNYSKLVACENKIAQLEADQSAANAVIAKINAIPSTINSNARDEISAARTAYNALTSSQKSLVTNLKRLTDAEAALQQYDAQQADKAAAENVEALIRAIPSTIDSNAKDEIQAARAAYNALTSVQKGYVSNYSRLTDAENALKTYEEQQAQIAADKAAANTVVAKINAIPTNLTLDDKDDVNAARTAYNALTSAQKGYVTNYSKLTSAEERIAALEEEAAEQAVVNAVIATINDIPDNLTLNDKAKVSAARNAYNGLTNAQKEKVVNYSDLTDAEATIAALEAQENANKADKEAADAVIAKINALPDEITLNDKTVVDVSRTAYDALTQKQKDLVTNYSTLTNAEASIKALEEYEAANKRDQEAAKAVIDLIDALPETITLEDKNNVVAARTAYDALTDKQKEIVTNYSELTAAEVKIAELEDDSYEEVQKVTFIGIMVDKDGNAYADKLIEIHSVVQNGRTDENGSFQFNNVEFGEHTIYIKSEDGSVIAQKSFDIRIGSPLSITDDEIVAENGAIFTVRMQVDGNNIKFLSVEEGNKAPVIDTDKGDEGGIDIGDDETPDDDDDDDDGINIGDADNDDGNKDDGSKPTPDQDVQSPQTGDNSNITLWVILLIVSLFGLCITSKKTFFEKKAR